MHKRKEDDVKSNSWLHPLGWIAKKEGLGRWTDHCEVTSHRNLERSRDICKAGMPSREQGIHTLPLGVPNVTA